MNIIVINFNAFNKQSAVKKLYIIVFALFVFNQLSAQGYATSKGAVILSGIAGFTSSGGEFYQGINNKTGTRLMLSPSIDYFILQNFFLSVDAEYAYTYNSQVKVNSIEIGPGIGYVFGKAESKILPFLSTGFLFNTQKNNYVSTPYDGYNSDNNIDNPYGYTIDNSNTTSTTFFIDTGVIIMVQKHIGLTIGATFHNQKYKFPDGYSKSGNTIALTLGINGLLYKM